MTDINKSDLNYEDYSWTATPGDDPSKRKEDADRFSRKEGYEVIYLLNSLKSTNGNELSVRTKLICEWMIHEKLPGNIQGRNKVINWISQNFTELKEEYPF